MDLLKDVLAQNREWARGVRESDPEFFNRLQHQQSPELLWIGCSDSRVPANQIVGVPPGSIFVHRNVANIVSHNDKNCMAVLQFGVDVLRVKHILVVGHYRCGGVGAVLDKRDLGLVSEWLRPMNTVRDHFWPLLQQIPADDRWDRLCELNVIDQARSVATSEVVTEAWKRGQELWVHGWIYGVHDGLLRDLQVTIGCNENPVAIVEQAARTALKNRLTRPSTQCAS